MKKKNCIPFHEGLKKIMVIMKITAVIVFLLSMHVYAESFGQVEKINLKMKTNIREVFDQLEKISGYRFVLKSDQAILEKQVDVDYSNERIDKILDNILFDTGYTYKVIDQYIAIVPVEEKNNSYQQEKTITGKVTDSSGISLPGVSVVIKGTTFGIISDNNGYYSLTNVPENATLQFSFVGMKMREIAVEGKTIINITMEEEIIGIEEVVAIGYGTTKKSDLTGAVTMVKSDELSYKTTANVAQALQGKVAGLQVTNSGAPGSSPKVQIRGLGSVRSDTEPLYVVDGILTNNISFLSNNDIESVTVLKDASASAIYGVRAANGVIIITLKRGKKDKISINYSGYSGYQIPVDVMKMANAKEYIQLLNEKGIIAASKTGGSFTPYDASKYNVSTDWFNEILREKAFTTSHDFGFSGGNEKTNYNLGIGYYKQEGLKLDDMYKRINIRSTLDSKIRDFMKIGYSAVISNTYSYSSLPDVFQHAFVAPPATPMIDEKTGNYMALTEFGDFNNPMVGVVYNNNKTYGIRLLGNGYAELYLSKELTFKSSYSVDASMYRNQIYKPKYELTGGLPKDEIEQLSKSVSNGQGYSWDNTLTFVKEFSGGHNLTAMAGMSAQNHKGSGLYGARLGVPRYGTDNTLYLNLGTPASQTNDDWGSHIASTSYFGRLNYSYLDRYLLTATIRRDGSSIFPKNNRYDIFPSVGLGWNIHKERFLLNQSLFNHLKFRASWGELGNNRIPEFTSVSTVDYGVWNSTEFGGVIAQGASATYSGPASLLWEKTREVDLAIEGSLLNSRLSFEFDYYNKKTIGAIFPVTVNSALGASNSSYLDNNADILNKGFEISLTWKDNIGKLNYRVNGNLSLNKNEVVALKPGTIGIYGGGTYFNTPTYTTIGHTIGEFYGRKVLGIFQNENEIQAYKGQNGTPIQPNAKPGDFKYYDINGDGMINDNDRTFLGSPLPTYNFSFSGYIEYKGIDFQVDFLGQGGNYIYNAKRFHQIGNENYDKYFYDHRWHGEGTSTTYPSADVSSNDNKAVNSWSVEKGDFFRIQNIQLGYSLPEHITSSIGLGSVRFYANATNPVTFFKYKGFTPEIIKSGSESTTSQGVDKDIYPMSATYSLGVNINF